MDKSAQKIPRAATPSAARTPPPLPKSVNVSLSLFQHRVKLSRGHKSSFDRHHHHPTKNVNYNANLATAPPRPPLTLASSPPALLLRSKNSSTCPDFVPRLQSSIPPAKGLLLPPPLPSFGPKRPEDENMPPANPGGRFGDAEVGVTLEELLGSNDDNLGFLFFLIFLSAFAAAFCCLDCSLAWFTRSNRRPCLHRRRREGKRRGGGEARGWGGVEERACRVLRARDSVPPCFR